MNLSTVSSACTDTKLENPSELPPKGKDFCNRSIKLPFGQVFYQLLLKGGWKSAVEGLKSIRHLKRYGKDKYGACSPPVCIYEIFFIFFLICFGSLCLASKSKSGFPLFAMAFLFLLSEQFPILHSIWSADPIYWLFRHFMRDARIYLGQAEKGGLGRISN